MSQQNLGLVRAGFAAHNSADLDVVFETLLVRGRHRPQASRGYR